MDSWHKIHDFSRGYGWEYDNYIIYFEELLEYGVTFNDLEHDERIWLIEHIEKTNIVGKTGISKFKKMTMPIIKRAYPTLLANQLVGVQPMTGPVGLAYALRFNDNKEDEKG